MESQTEKPKRDWNSFLRFLAIFTVITIVFMVAWYFFTDAAIKVNYYDQCKSALIAMKNCTGTMVCIK